MAEFLSITALARKTGVSSKALRYWETLGLVPKASRSPTGYRLFPPQTPAYIAFVKRSKEMGLKLQQMRAVLGLARQGRSPCGEVEGWIDCRIRELETEIRSLCALQESLKGLHRDWSRASDSGSPSKGCCSLLVGLPEAEPFRAPADDVLHGCHTTCECER